ncbi:hypothetical protein [Streptococcus lutetiensis]|uniref:hypothetical protein n=1 Tax=Streptococcus lutetiensis TaxID=150055 RepID=UPI001BDB4053|nr:hypothetical protein [Streptococcus lutetiensis]MBT0933114.1 hypothetical protein [Streptococcus lutetiensis]
MSKLIATSQLTLMNLTEKAIERTEVTFWHGLSATKHPLGVYDCGSRDHAFANEFDVVSGKKYTVRIIAQRTKGAINLKGGIWYTERTSGYQFDGLAALTQVGELSEDGLGIWERTLTVPNGKTKGRVYVQLEQSSTSGFSTAYRVYDAQVFDENGQPLVTDQNNFGALTSPMAAPDGTYIWKRTITHYTDGTNDTVWEYSGVGEKGNTGANGQTSHVHFAFADNATGGGFSLTTPKAYMGWYADFNEAASTDPTKYRWSKWKGDQGLPGKPGADGKTSYFHMAYADSADGRTGFSFKESGQQYQGYYTDFTQTSSTDPNKYTWMDRRAGVEVGGKNLLLYTADPWKAPNDYYQNVGAIKTDETLNGSIVYKTRSAWASLRSNWGKHLIDRKNVKVGDEFTYSIYAKTDQNSMKVRLFDRFSGQSGADALTGEIALTNEWQKLSVTFKVTEKMVASQSKLSWVGFEQVKNSEDGKFVYYACNMLEEGNIPTPWQPALEDIQSDIDSKADQTLTQEQLNALAEKNNLIKAEMEAKASIDTVDKWITAYENYVKANDADKAKSEQALKEASERILGMRYEVNDLKFVWDAIDRFMSFQNEGLVIGKKDGSAYAKFSDDRISLFSGSSEVMYISQGTLNIANGIFTKTIQIGRFRFETHPADVDMLVLRYLGG